MTRNTSNISENMFNLDFLSSQEKKLVNTVEELQNRIEKFWKTTSPNLRVAIVQTLSLI